MAQNHGKLTFHVMQYKTLHVIIFQILMKFSLLLVMKLLVSTLIVGLK